ncbi:MarR family winged helix-turn-helix transcriptional regulator [Streptococcus dentasini]
MNQSELVKVFESLDRIYMKLEKRRKESLTEAAYNRLTVTEVHTLYAIGKDDLKTMKDISERLGIAPNTATVAVDRLVAKKLVTKQASPEDRRVQLVQVTQDAITIMDSIDSELFKDIGQLLSPLTDIEALLFKSLLEKIDDHL